MSNYVSNYVCLCVTALPALTAGIKWRGKDYASHTLEEIRDLQKQTVSYLPELSDYFRLERRYLYPQLFATTGVGGAYSASGSGSGAHGHSDGSATSGASGYGGINSNGSKTNGTNTSSNATNSTSSVQLQMQRSEELLLFAEHMAGFRLSLSSLPATQSFGKCRYLHR